MELRARSAHHQAGYDDGPAAWSRVLRPRVHAAAPVRLLLDLRAASREESLDLLVRSAPAALSEVAGAAVDYAVTLPRRYQPSLVQGTSDTAVASVHDDEAGGEGPVSQALTGRMAVIANSYAADPRWPAYWRAFRRAGYRSEASVPVPLRPGFFAALTLLSGEDNVFTAPVVAAAAAFSRRAGISYVMAEELRTAQDLVDQLDAALQTRTAIDVACGVIMAQNHCSYDDAFAILARASSHRNVKLRLVATALLESMPA
jgi:GAF domain-containing protein